MLQATLKRRSVVKLPYCHIRHTFLGTRNDAGVWQLQHPCNCTPVVKALLRIKMIKISGPPTVYSSVVVSSSSSSLKIKTHCSLQSMTGHRKRETVVADRDVKTCFASLNVERNDNENTLAWPESAPISLSQNDQQLFAFLLGFSCCQLAE